MGESVGDLLFLQVVADYCELDGGSGTYLVMTDRYSGWLLLSYKRGMVTTEELICDMRTWFMTYRAPVEFASDGGKTNIIQVPTIPEELGLAS